MKTLTVKCAAASRSQVDHIMDSLNEAGIPDDDISVSFPGPDLDRPKNARPPDGMDVGAVIGGIMGGLLGGLAAYGVVTIPGTAPFITHGPVLAVLCGAVIGAALAGILGGLIGFSLPDSAWDAGDGKIVLFIHAMDAKEAAEIKNVLREENAWDIQVAGQTPMAARDQPQHEPQFAGH